jgi:transposase
MEIKIKEFNSQVKYDYYQEHATSLLNEFDAWLNKSAEQVIPKTALGKAWSYNLIQWLKLISYLESGELNIDNNRAERALVIGLITGFLVTQPKVHMLARYFIV